jgi:histidine ammonia-lyase
MDREFARRPLAVALSGKDLGVPEILAVARHNAVVHLTKEPDVLTRITACYDRMMQDVEVGIPVYGCNTGYGAQAAQVLATGSPSARLWFARTVSESIGHTDVAVGPVFPKDVIRAAMLIRVNMLLGGVSAVKIADLELYGHLLNCQITPLVNQYGGLGASGDLAHNGRIVSALRQLPGVKVWDKVGRVREAREVLTEQQLPPLQLDPKAGLGLCNGDNFSTGLAILLAADTLEGLLIAIVLGALTIEVLRGSNRSFHPQLDVLRPHAGQREVARVCRYLLEGSQLAYQEMKGHQGRAAGIAVQDGYSLRGLSQYHAVNVEKIKAIFSTLIVNANSVSDNPLWVAPEHAIDGEAPWQWVSGANFLAMHMVEALDSLRKINDTDRQTQRPPSGAVGQPAPQQRTPGQPVRCRQRHALRLQGGADPGGHARRLLLAPFHPCQHLLRRSRGRQPGHHRSFVDLGNSRPGKPPANALLPRPELASPRPGGRSAGRPSQPFAPNAAAVPVCPGPRGRRRERTAAVG